MKKRLSMLSPIREAYERAERLKDDYGVDNVFDFSIGNPSAPCPNGVKRALTETSEQSSPVMHGYMHDRGYAEVRKAVADSLNRRFGADFDAECIIMTAGAACALNVLMCTVLDPGDEVIAFLPCYPAYSSFVQNWGGRFVPIPFETETLLPDLDAFASSLTQRTKMVLVNSPNNPTGLVYPEKVVRGISEALKDWQSKTGADVMLVSDEPYRELAFDGAKASWWPCLYDNTAVVYSWSKSASVAGERIGYVALPTTLADWEMVRRGVCRALGDLGFVNAPATAQRIALHCVEDTIDVAYYDANRRALYDGLCALGFTPLPGNGAFYLLLPAPDGDEATFVDRLAENRVVVVGGSAFGCPGYVRLSYCIDPSAIHAALPRFAAVAKHYGLLSNPASEKAVAIPPSETETTQHHSKGVS